MILPQASSSPTTSWGDGVGLDNLIVYPEKMRESLESMNGLVFAWRCCSSRRGSARGELSPGSENAMAVWRRALRELQTTRSRKWLDEAGSIEYSISSGRWSTSTPSTVSVRLTY
jgi:hypothetical protein